MIDVKNLMLGNFVKKRGEILVVGKIHRESVADKWGGIAFDDEIDGIPMTIETLLAIGFTRVQDIRDYHYYRYWDKEGKYKLDVDYYFGNSEKKWHVHIDNEPWMWICHFCKEVFEIIYSRIRYRAITRKGVSNVAEVKPADDFYSYCGFPVFGKTKTYMAKVDGCFLRFDPQISNDK